MNKSKTLHIFLNKVYAKLRITTQQNNKMEIINIQCGNMKPKQNAQLSVRLRAIWCCIWFGLVPWPVYERKCHYSGMTYIQHLMLNVEFVAIWITGKELHSDWEFEKKTNPSWSVVIRNMFCLPKKQKLSSQHQQQKLEYEK